MMFMCKFVFALKLFLDIGYNRLVWDLVEADENILDWSIHQDANTTSWLLNHISTVLNVYIPRAITGDLSYKPKGWRDDASPDSMKGLLEEIECGKNQAIEALEKLSPDKLLDEIDWYLGTDTRKDYLVLLVSEVIHHEGQIAALIGLNERIKGNKPRVQPPE